jgi:hypothetical protein
MVVWVSRMGLCQSKQCASMQHAYQ